MKKLIDKYIKEREYQNGVYMRNKDGKDTNSMKVCISALSKKEVLDKVIMDLQTISPPTQ